MKRYRTAVASWRGFGGFEDLAIFRKHRPGKKPGQCSDHRRIPSSFKTKA
jgi:hypothetical protein